MEAKWIKQPGLIATNFLIWTNRLLAISRKSLKRWCLWVTSHLQLKIRRSSYIRGILPRKVRQFTIIRQLSSHPVWKASIPFLCLASEKPRETWKVFRRIIRTSKKSPRPRRQYKTTEMVQLQGCFKSNNLKCRARCSEWCLLKTRVTPLSRFSSKLQSDKVVSQRTHVKNRARVMVDRLSIKFKGQRSPKTYTWVLTNSASLSQKRTRLSLNRELRSKKALIRQNERSMQFWNLLSNLRSIKSSQNWSHRRAALDRMTHQWCSGWWKLPSRVKMIANRIL